MSTLASTAQLENEKKKKFQLKTKRAAETAF